MPVMPGPPVMRPPACPISGTHSARNDLSRHKEREKPLCISFILLVLPHQEILLLWLWVFSDSMTRESCSPLLSKREEFWRELVGPEKSNFR